MHGSRVNVKVERRSTLTFTRDRTSLPLDGHSAAVPEAPSWKD